MEVPKDYVIDIVRQALDDKIEATELNLTNEIHGIRADFIDLKSEIREFRTQCRTDMSDLDKRVKSTEEFKVKVVAIAGAIAALSAFIFDRLRI